MYCKGPADDTAYIVPITLHHMPYNISSEFIRQQSAVAGKYLKRQVKLADIDVLQVVLNGFTFPGLKETVQKIPAKHYDTSIKHWYVYIFLASIDYMIIKSTHIYHH